MWSLHLVVEAHERKRAQNEDLVDLLPGSEHPVL